MDLHANNLVLFYAKGVTYKLSSDLSAGMLVL